MTWLALCLSLLSTCSWCVVRAYTWLALSLSSSPHVAGVWWAHTLDWLYISLSSPPVAGVWWAHTLDWLYVSLLLFLHLSAKSWFAPVITSERLFPVCSACLCNTLTVSPITIPAACLDLIACPSTLICLTPALTLCPSTTCVLYCLLLLINCRWILKLLSRHNSKHWYFNMEHSSLWYKVHPNITLITVLIILFATANNEGGIIIFITDSG